MFRQAAVPTAISILALLLVGLLVYGVSSGGTDRTIDDQLRKGQRPVAPVAELPKLVSAQEAANDPTGSVKDYRGKVVVLNFWASWCIPCEDEAPLLEKIQRKIASQGGVVLGVTYKNASEKARGFERKYGITYPSLRDNDGSFARKYGTTTGIPETFVIDRRGRIVSALRNAIDEDFYARQVEPVLTETR